jgi:hypothetical protein
MKRKMGIEIEPSRVKESRNKGHDSIGSARLG